MLVSVFKHQGVLAVAITLCSMIPDSASAESPTIQQSGYATIECEVDGRLVRCMIVTGIRRSLIDSTTFDMRGREIGDVVGIKDSPETTIEVTPLSEEIRVSSGNVLVDLKHVGVADLSRLQSNSVVEFDMILGNDFLENVVLNVAPKRIWVSSHFDEDPQRFDTVPLKVEDNRPVLPVSLPGLGVREFQIFTGRNGTIDITEPTASRMRELNLVKDMSNGWHFSVNGLESRRGLICAGATIGSASFSNLPAHVDVSNSIGMGLLKHMRISLDWRNQLIYLEKDRSRTINWFPRNDSGVLCKFPERSKLLIVNVIADSPGSTANLAANDEILSIEGKVPGELTVDSVGSFFSPSDSPVRIVYSRNGQQHETMMRIPKTYEYPPKWEKPSEQKAREFFEQLESDR